MNIPPLRGKPTKRWDVLSQLIPRDDMFLASRETKNVISNLQPKVKDCEMTKPRVATLILKKHRLLQNRTQRTLRSTELTEKNKLNK